jgi:GT2 family glycosyltransferase
MVSIIVLNYNGGSIFANLLGSIEKHLKDVQDWELLIRDNSENDSDKEIFDQFFKGNPKFRYFKMKNEGNFSSMNNEMIKHANGDVLLFLNNDMEARTDFLTPMERLLNEPNMGVVGAILIYPDKRIQHAGIVFDKMKRPQNIGRYHFDRNMVDSKNFLLHDRYFQAVTGACLMIRKQDFNAVGGFSEEFTWCFDDVELCLKVRNLLKKNCAISCDAGLMHIENYTVLKNPSELSPKAGNVQENFDRLMKKWGPEICHDIEFYQADYGRVR